MKDLIVNAVEDKSISGSDKRSVCAFIERQDNIYKKVENNINQFARIANAQKHLSNDLMDRFNLHLSEIARLKKIEADRVNVLLDFLANGDKNSQRSKR